MSGSDELEVLARIAVDCGYRLHRDVGPGLLESAYEKLLAAYLSDVGLDSKCQVVVPIRHKGQIIDNAFRVDIIVEGKLLLELKSAERISSIHPMQVLTYLRILNMPLGLLMNFGMPTFKEGLKRIANDYYGTIG